MSTINRTGHDDHKETEQWMQNNSFDREFKVNAVENLVYNSSTGNMDRMEQPATADSNALLRRIVKLLESQATVDIANRQKVTLDAATTGVFTSMGYAVNGINIPTGGMPTFGGGYYYLPVWESPVDQRFRIMDAARMTYDQGIRSHLTFS